MKCNIFIISLLLFFLFHCGSPDFIIDNSRTEESTLSIIYFFPTTDYSKGIKADMPIVFIFSENIDVDSALKGLSIEKTGPGQRQNVKPRCNYNETEYMLQCLPESGRWDLKSNYSIKIKDVKSRDGTKVLDKEYSYTFSTI
ncbi:MAG: Ig-like domain-containing protein [Myxococcota bacterium]